MREPLVVCQQQDALTLEEAYCLCLADVVIILSLSQDIRSGDRRDLPMDVSRDVISDAFGLTVDSAIAWKRFAVCRIPMRRHSRVTRAAWVP